MICLFSSSHAEMLQGGDAAGGDAQAGEHLPHGLVAWAQWQLGHDGTVGTVTPWQVQPRDGTAWHGTKHPAYWAKSWAGPSYGPMPAPWPCQVVSHAKS